jgi:hypothetical protein
MHDLGIAVNFAKEHPHAAFVFGSVHTETHPPRHSNHEGQCQDMLYKITLPLQDAKFDVQLCCAVSVRLKLGLLVYLGSVKTEKDFISS